MTTRTLRNAMAAALASYALVTSALPLAAETDSTSVPVARQRPSTVGLARATMLAASGADRAAASRAYRRVLSPWRETGVLFPDALEAVGSGQVAGAGVGAAAAEAPGTDAVRQAIGPRVRSRISGSLDRPPAAAPRSSLERRAHRACDALCTVLGGVGSKGGEDSARVRKLMVRLVAGYELSHGQRISLRPKVQRVRGQPRTGLSVRVSGV